MKLMKTNLILVALTLLPLGCVDTASAFTCRSQSVKKAFDIIQGYPQGRKGYIVDHVCPLSQGGLDSYINLQYQTIAEAKLKDRIESTSLGKLKFCNSSNSLPIRTVYNCK